MQPMWTRGVALDSTALLRTQAHEDRGTSTEESGAFQKNAFGGDASCPDPRQGEQTQARASERKFQTC